MSNSTTSSPRELHSRAFHRTTCVVKSSRSRHERQRTPESHMRTAICADGDPQHAQSRKYCTSGSRANRFSLQCSVNALIRQRARCTNAPRISQSSLPARRRHRVKSMPEGRVATLKQVGSLQEFTCDEVATLGQVGSPRDCPPGRVATLGQVGGPRDCPPGRVATLGQVGSPRDCPSGRVSARRARIARPTTRPNDEENAFSPTREVPPKTRFPRLTPGRARPLKPPAKRRRRAKPMATTSHPKASPLLHTFRESARRIRLGTRSSAPIRECTTFRGAHPLQRTHAISQNAP